MSAAIEAPADGAWLQAKRFPCSVRGGDGKQHHLSVKVPRWVPGFTREKQLAARGPIHVEMLGADIEFVDENAAQARIEAYANRDRTPRGFGIDDSVGSRPASPRRAALIKNRETEIHAFKDFINARLLDCDRMTDEEILRWNSRLRKVEAAIDADDPGMLGAAELMQLRQLFNAWQRECKDPDAGSLRDLNRLRARYTHVKNVQASVGAARNANVLKLREIEQRLSIAESVGLLENGGTSGVFADEDRKFAAMQAAKNLSRQEEEFLPKLRAAIADADERLLKAEKEIREIELAVSNVPVTRLDEAYARHIGANAATLPFVSRVLAFDPKTFIIRLFDGTGLNLLNGSRAKRARPEDTERSIAEFGV